MKTSLEATIAANLRRVQERIEQACARAGRSASEVHLVAVTKKVDVAAVRALYDCGIRDFGESRPQVLWKKQPLLPDDCRWHMIGHLQTNKVRRTLPMVALLHSLDRQSLIDEVKSESERLKRNTPATIQVNLTQEDAKSGFEASQLLDVVAQIGEEQGVDVQGVMAMARQEEDVEHCRPTFRTLFELREKLRDRMPDRAFPVLSMGMSQDFEIAIEEGATHVRVGTALFEGLLDD